MGSSRLDLFRRIAPEAAVERTGSNLLSARAAKPQKKVARAAWAAIEGLEGRVMLAAQVITVMNNLDEVAGVAVPSSLRDAINMANADAPTQTTIQFASGLGAITLDASLPAITASGTVIDGSAGTGGVVTVEAASASGINGFDVQAPSVTIEDMSLQTLMAGIILDTGSSAAGIYGNQIGDVNNTGVGQVGTDIIITNGSNNNTIGGSGSEYNVLAGVPDTGVMAGSIGVLIEDPSSLGTSNNTVTGNSIGVGLDSVTDVGGQIGISLDNVEDNVIQDNSIAGQTAEGILTQGSGSEFGNSIDDNTIGINPVGFGPPILNGIGIKLANGAEMQGDSINGNSIGPNSSEGVDISGSNNTVVNNGISSNGGVGIEIETTGKNNTLSQNSIEGNDQAGDQLGIDLGNNDAVLANQAGGGVLANGANGNQPFPVITSITADADGTDLDVNYTLNANVNTSYTIEFFANAANAVSSSGFGQGQTYITNATGTTTLSAMLSGTVKINAATYGADYITATATNTSAYNMATNPDAGSTSEFAANVPAPTVSLPTLSIINAVGVVGAASPQLTFTTTLSSSAGSAVSCMYVLTPLTAAPADYQDLGSGMLTIPPGTTQVNIPIGIVADSSGASETFQITLSSLSADAAFANGLATETAIGTILPATGALTSDTSLNVSAAAVALDGSETFTATVTGQAGHPTPSGTVTFTAGAFSVGTAVVNASGVATLTTLLTTPGAFMYTAVYTGDANYATSTSGAVSVMVANQPATATTTSITATATAMPLNGQVTIFATVIPTANNGGAPAGTVDFYDGATLIGQQVLAASGNDGTAQFIVSAANLAAPVVGTHQITVTYVGSVAYGPSTSSALSLTVGANNGIATTISLTTSNATVTTGVAVTFTATVNGGGPAITGSVTFLDNGLPIGEGAVSGGVATLITGSLPLGQNNITATYGGDINHLGSSTAAALSETILTALGNVVTTTVVTANNDIVGIGVTVDFTITVTATNMGSPTGSVTIYANGIAIGTATLAAGPNDSVATFVYSALPAGLDSIVASYGGDNVYAPSTSAAIIESVGPISQGATITTLTASAASISYGDSETLTATVSAGAGNATPTGMVSFLNGDTTIDVATLVGGVATFTTSTLAAGLQTFRATYDGSPGISASTSALVSVNVNPLATSPSATSVVVTPSPSSIAIGGLVTFTANVASAIGSIPPGTVTFYDSTEALATVDVDASGAAVFSTSTLPQGLNTITATYNGASGYTISTSPAVIETVGSASTGPALLVSVTLTPGAATANMPVTIVAVVTQAGSTPTGTVTFSANGMVIGTAPVSSDGTATFVTSLLPSGNVAITAVFSNGVTSATSNTLVEIIAPQSPVVPSVGAVSIPAVVVAGSKISAFVPVIITNTSTTTISGIYTVNIFLNADATLDGNEVQVYSKTRRLTLTSGEVKDLSVHLTSLSSALVQGTNHLIVQVLDPNKAASETTTNYTTSVQAAYVSLSATTTPITPAVVSTDALGRFDVTITNTGNETVSGALQIVLSASSDGINPNPNEVLYTFNSHGRLKAHQSKTYRLKFIQPANMVGGPYYPYLAITLGASSTIVIGKQPFSVGL